MNQEHARRLNQQWDAKDAERDEREQRARQLFLEEHANQIFATIEDFLTRLNQVLHAVGWIGQDRYHLGAPWRSKVTTHSEGNIH